MEIVELQKTVQGPFTGQQFKIRKVRIKEFVQHLGMLPLQASETLQNAMESIKERIQSSGADMEDKVTRFYISRGVVAPKVWIGAEEECPEGQIYYEDLGSDFDWVAGEVIAYSYEMATLDKFFRGAGAGAPGPNGEAVRSATIEPPAPGDV